MATSGKYQQVELAFDVDADTFFMLTTNYGLSGAKIERHDRHFVLTLEQETSHTSG